MRFKIKVTVGFSAVLLEHHAKNKCSTSITLKHIKVFGFLLFLFALLILTTEKNQVNLSWPGTII